MSARNGQSLITFGFSVEGFKVLVHDDNIRYGLLRAAGTNQLRQAVFRAATFLDNWETTHPEQPKFPHAIKPAVRLIP